MQADQEVSLLRESSQRCRQAVSPLMLALLLVHDMVRGSNGVEGGGDAGCAGIQPDLSQELYKVSPG